MEKFNNLNEDIDPISNISERDVKNAIMYSIARQEFELARLLSVESEKLYKGVRQARSVEELLCLNRSVSETLCSIEEIEGLLVDKLELILCFECPIECNCEEEE